MGYRGWYCLKPSNDILGKVSVSHARSLNREFPTLAKGGRGDFPVICRGHFGRRSHYPNDPACRGAAEQRPVDPGLIPLGFPHV